MPPGRVAPNGGTRSQGGAVQIGCERADCDTNNAAAGPRSTNQSKTSLGLSLGFPEKYRQKCRVPSQSVRQRGVLTGVSQMRRRRACAVLPESCHLFYASCLLLHQLQIPHLRRRFLAVKRTHAPFANAAHDSTTAIPPQMTKIIVAVTCCSGRLAPTRTAPACKTKLCLSLGSQHEGRRDSSSRPRNHRGSDPDFC